MRSSKLIEVINSVPEAVQVIFLIILFVFSGVSIYARININFGAKVFSNIPKDELRTNIFHIIRYTVTPALIFMFLIVTTSKKGLQNTPSPSDQVEMAYGGLLEMEDLSREIYEIENNIVQYKITGDQAQKLLSMRSEKLKKVEALRKVHPDLSNVHNSSINPNLEGVNFEQWLQEQGIALK